MSNYEYVKFYRIDVLMCSSSQLMIEISCFGDFCSIKCKPWIGEWLLFIHV